MRYLRAGVWPGRQQGHWSNWRYSGVSQCIEAYSIYCASSGRGVDRLFLGHHVDSNPKARKENTQALIEHLQAIKSLGSHFDRGILAPTPTIRAPAQPHQHPAYTLLGSSFHREISTAASPLPIRSLAQAQAPAPMLSRLTTAPPTPPQSPRTPLPSQASAPLFPCPPPHLLGTRISRFGRR